MLIAGIDSHADGVDGVPMVSDAEQIALSAAFAAWAGAAASTFASVVALGIAIWGARREETYRRRLVKDQEAAFAFGMIGALERIKPLIVEAREKPTGEIGRRRYRDLIDNAHMIADAALGIAVFDMQMLRDAYRLRGVLNALRSITEDADVEAAPNAAVLEIIEPVLGAILDADDRFAARIPAMATIEGAQHRIPIDRPAPR